MFDENLIANKYLNPDEYLNSFKVDFLKAKPFPSIVIKEFFQEKFLSSVLEEFPDLEKIEFSQNTKIKTNLSLLAIIIVIFQIQ